MRRLRDHAGIDQASLFKLQFRWAIMMRFWRRVLCVFHDGIGLIWWWRRQIGRFEPGLIDDEQSDQAGNGIQNVRNVVTVHTGPIRMKLNVAPWRSETKYCQEINKASRLRKDLGARDRRDERDGRGFEVRSSRFSERRTPNFELWIAPFSQVSRFARHGLWRWQTFSASC